MFPGQDRQDFFEIMEAGQGLALTQGLGNNRVVSAAHWEYNEAYASFAGKKDVDLAEMDTIPASMFP